jgi:hypothetical protein
MSMAWSRVKDESSTVKTEESLHCLLRLLVELVLLDRGKLGRAGVVTEDDVGRPRER